MKMSLKIALGVIAVAIGVLLAVVALLVYCFGVPKQYVTNDIANYGEYTGNYDNQSVKEFIVSFFPAKVEDHFSDVVYSYRAQKNDAYAFEAYLAFTIKDKTQYNAFIEEHTEGLEQHTFRYDASYQEYTISDVFRPSVFENRENGIHISYAKIGKILCCEEKQEVIFVALGVYDGGVVKTNFLTVYFDRFQIDPLEYALYTAPEYNKE